MDSFLWIETVAPVKMGRKEWGHRRISQYLRVYLGDGPGWSGVGEERSGCVLDGRRSSTDKPSLFS